MGISALSLFIDVAEGYELHRRELEIARRRKKHPYTRAVPEAPLDKFGSGLAPAGDGWFVVNVRGRRVVDVGKRREAAVRLGVLLRKREFEFPQFGIRLHVLEPSEPNGLYHSESEQEAFLVLSGECRLLVEGEERLLRQWTSSTVPPGPSTSSSVPATGRA